MSEVIRKLQDYQPTKTTWIWSCVGTCILTMIVGFTWGGWVTGGTAAEDAQTASKSAVTELAASICVHRFLAAPDASGQLAALKKTDTWKRNGLIEEGGWVTFANMKEPVPGASKACADQLAQAELPLAAAETIPPTESVN